MHSQSECVYVASRRGYKGPRRGTAQNPNKRHASSSPDASGDATAVSGSDGCSMLMGATAPPLTSTAAFTPSAALESESGSPFLTAAASMSHLQLYRASPFASSVDGTVQHPGALPRVTSIADKCLDSYFYHQHASHPFVLPKSYLLRHIRETGQKLGHLMAAMRYVGSLYLDAGPARASYLDEALGLCYASNTPQDGFLVQALLILLVALDGSCQQDKARDLLADCERIAVEIGLNTRQFATLHGRGSPVLEESWRRTWWDLYVCDGMVAGVHRVTNFILFDMVADVALPCEESEYLSGASSEVFLSYEFSRLTIRHRIYHNPCIWKTLTISCSLVRTGRSHPSHIEFPRSEIWGGSCDAHPSCSPRTRTWPRWKPS